MASFEIRSASDFLQKLRDEYADFTKSHCLNERHALNAVMTAYHLHEWVWGGFAKDRTDLFGKWGVSSAKKKNEQFEDYIIRSCPEFADARELTNGTKHFAPKVPTGKHEGAFQRGAFQDNAFDVSYLWIERDGKECRAEKFVQGLINFWELFFKEQGIT